jgi:hypothetical protein
MHACVQTNERAAAESEAAYRNLVDLEQRSQGRVMSRPISACTHMLAPLLLQEWQVCGVSLGQTLRVCLVAVGGCKARHAPGDGGFLASHVSLLYLCMPQVAFMALYLPIPLFLPTCRPAPWKQKSPWVGANGIWRA